MTPVSGVMTGLQENLVSPPRRSDYRLRAMLAMLVGIPLLGMGVSWLPGRSVVADRVAEKTATPPAQPVSFEALKAAGAAGRELASEELIVTESKTPPANPEQAEARTILKDAAKAIQAKRYDAALLMLDAARPKIQQQAESYLLVGRALEGKKDHTTARDFYNAALDRNPELAEAYWGMATTSEVLGDLETALGGMRSFLHTVPNKDPNYIKNAQARSAIWEWEAQLGRGPWGPTKGIIPGITPEQARRVEGKGAAIMMPLKETLAPDGSTKFEIKHQDKFELFKKK
jgi:tetratricopeptide (TPR) repeat protein